MERCSSTAGGTHSASEGMCVSPPSYPLPGSLQPMSGAMGTAVGHVPPALDAHPLVSVQLAAPGLPAAGGPYLRQAEVAAVAGEGGGKGGKMGKWGGKGGKWGGREENSRGRERRKMEGKRRKTVVGGWGRGCGVFLMDGGVQRGHVLGGEKGNGSGGGCRGAMALGGCKGDMASGGGKVEG